MIQNYTNSVTIQKVEDIHFQSRLEKFIQECFLLLQNGVLPNQVLNNECSLVERIFQMIGERHFDNYLSLLFPLIEELVKRGMNFKERIIDLTCQQIAFLYCEQLAKENHKDSQNAWKLFELMGYPDDIDDCLFVRYLERAAYLLRSKRPNPNQVVWGQSMLESIFVNMASGFYEERHYAIPDLILALLECRGDPNLQFKSIKIEGDGVYHNATCLHVAYLYWRSLKAAGKVNEAKSIKKVFYLLLEDPRTDVKAQFEEMFTEGKSCFTDCFGTWNCLEKGNLAHYALAGGDLATCQKVLSKAPNLINSICVVREAKYHRSKLGSDVWVSKFSLLYHNKISLCHIAAKRLDSIACAFFSAIGNNTNICDSDGVTPGEYISTIKKNPWLCTLPPSEQVVKDILKIFRNLQPLTSNLPKFFYILHQEGYDVMYHPVSKCPIVFEVLYEGSLVKKIESSKHKNYRQNTSIPQLNRASVEDFKNGGVVLGHGSPRANSLSSDQALYDAGYLTNIIAQNPTLNNGLWKKLEQNIRKSTLQHLCLHVYTGGVFTSPVDVKGAKTISYRVIGQNEVSVPTHLFKVIYYFDYGIGWQSYAYLIPNEPLVFNTDLQPYFVKNVSRIQELTGVGFQEFYNKR